MSSDKALYVYVCAADKCLGVSWRSGCLCHSKWGLFVIQDGIWAAAAAGLVLKWDWVTSSCCWQCNVSRMRLSVVQVPESLLCSESISTLCQALCCHGHILSGTWAGCWEARASLSMLHCPSALVGQHNQNGHVCPTFYQSNVSSAATHWLAYSGNDLKKQWN